MGKEKSQVLRIFWIAVVLGKFRSILEPSIYVKRIRSILQPSIDVLEPSIDVKKLDQYLSQVPL